MNTCSILIYKQLEGKWRAYLPDGKEPLAFAYQYFYEMSDSGEKDVHDFTVLRSGDTLTFSLLAKSKKTNPVHWNSKSLKGNGVWVEVSKLSPMTVDSRNLIVPGVSVGMLKLGMSYEKIIKIFGDPVDKYYYPDASIHDIRYKSKKTGNRIIFCFDTYGKCIEAIFTSGAFKTAEGIGRDEFSINMHRDLYNGFSRKCCLINYVNVRYYAKDGISFQYYNIKPGSGYKDSWIQGYVSVYLPEYKEPPLFPIGVGHWRENCGAFASGESRR